MKLVTEIQVQKSDMICIEIKQIMIVFVCRCVLQNIIEPRADHFAIDEFVDHSNFF